MLLYKNVDISDLESILEKGILSLNESDNDNWEDNKRGDNSKDLVYLFSPIKGMPNSFPIYGAALLEVEVDATENVIALNDRHFGKYKEYVTSKVLPSQIINIYVPTLFKEKLSDFYEEEEFLSKITFCELSAKYYDGLELKKTSVEVLQLFGETARFISTQEYGFFRGIDSEGKVLDLYDVFYDLKSDKLKEIGYRISFSGKNDCKSVDVQAINSEDAFNKAYKMPESKSGQYTDIWIEKIPTEPSVIGIEFKYTDTAIKKNFHGCLFIKANNEAEAVNYYNEYYKGQRFWFNAGEIVEDGKCIRGDVIQTYFAACPGYDADATLKTEYHNKRQHR